MSFDYKIYSLTNSDQLDDVRYIGKTKLDLDKRLYFHIKSIDYEKTYKANWIKSVLNRGNKIVIKEILSGLNESESINQEIKFIKEFKEKGFNGTNGGDGLSNPTQETIEKISKSCKKMWETKTHINKGKTLEEIYGVEKAILLKENSKKQQIGKKIPNEQKEKSKKNHAKYWLGKHLNEEHTNKLRNGFKKANLVPGFQKNRTKNMIKPIVKMDLLGNKIKTWNSIKEAADNLKIKRDSIGLCCSGKRNTGHGFVWEFIKKETR